MPQSTTDRNLLFGILALQMDFIRRDALIVAMNAWVLEKAKPLGRILLEQKALSADTHALLEALVEKHLALHGHDAEKSLAAVSSVASIRNELARIADPDMQASLAFLPAPSGSGTGVDGSRAVDEYATVAAPSVGKPTSDGLRFRILRPHAKGGLGEVHVAHDGELNREVALKEIQNKHADHPESRARFLLEAEITGGLEHPGIVPVYGLGTYADGRPFYAMRFIRGDSLQDAIKRFHQSPGTAVPGLADGERTLELRKLLGRLIDVCNAIQYAHDRGILHRDLKPGNIMLGKYGETLVVDWGLAKSRGERGGSVTGENTAVTAIDEPALRPVSISGSAETVAGTAVGTPQYMSPEQAAGRLDILGPASDVYSLGATLYCVLTGKPAVADKDLGAILHKVQTGDFPRPRQLKPDIDKAMEAICLKAMALQPADRYASPRELADDIEHWLADEPVGAYRESWPAQAGRWARRHRTSVTAAVAALVVAVVGLLAATVLLGAANERERDAKELAEKNEGDAKAQRRQADILREQAGLAQRRAEANADEAIRQQQAADEQRRLAQTETEKATTVSRFLVGMFESSDPLGLSGFSYAIPKATGEKLTARDVLDRGATRIENDRTMAPLVRAALLDTIGNVYRSLGQHAEAAKLLQAALALRTETPGCDPLERAASLHNLGWLHHERGDYAKALDLYRQALKIRAEQPAPDPKLVGASQLNLGWVLIEMRQHAEADRIFQDLLDHRRKLWGDDHRETALVRIALAGSYLDQGRFLEAMPLAMQGIDALIKIEGNSAMGQALGLFQGAVLNSNLFKDHAGAEKKLAECLKITKRSLGDQHIYVTMVLYQLGSEQTQQDKWADAEATMRECVAIVRLQTGMRHPRAGMVVKGFVTILRQRGKQAEGNELYEELLQAQRDKFGPDDPYTLETINDLALGYRAAGKLDRALPLFEEALKGRKAKLGPGHRRTLDTMDHLGRGYQAAGKLDLAVPLLEETVKLCKAHLGPDDFDTLISTNTLAVAYAAAGKLDLAVPLYEDTAKRMKTTLGLAHRETLNVINNLRIAYLGAKQPEKTLPLIGEYVAGQRKLLGAKDPRFGDVLATLSLDLLNARQYPEAEKLLRECLSIRQKNQPGAWTTWHTQAQLGGALLAQKKYADAEPLLWAACEWMKENEAKVPANAKVRLTETEGRLAELFEATRSKDETKLQGKLTDAKTDNTHEVKLTAGKPVVLSMQSTQFDTLLRLQDAKGKTLAENDDIDFANKNLHSRILFIPKEDGVYRIIATSFQRIGRGEYDIVVRQYSAATSK